MSSDARARAYAEITQNSKEWLARYFEEFPEEVDNVAGSEGVAWVLRNLKATLRILDQYEIRDRPKPKDEAPTA